MGCANSKENPGAARDTNHAPRGARSNGNGRATQDAVLHGSLSLPMSSTGPKESPATTPEWPSTPVIWMHGTVEETRGECSWTDVYRRLYHKSNSDALLNLSVLPMRNWAKKWETACAALAEVHPDDIDVEDNSLDTREIVADISAEFYKKEERTPPSVWALRQKLKLQEQLNWMAKLVLTGLTADHESTLLQHIYFSLTQKAESGSSPQHTCNWITTGEESDVDKLRALLIKGMEFNGVFFRLVVSDDDWATIRRECRAASSSRLIVVVEGMGMRIMASAILPPASTVDKNNPRNLLVHPPPRPRGILCSPPTPSSSSSSPLYLHFDPKTPTPTVSAELGNDWAYSRMGIFGTHVAVHYGHTADMSPHANSWRVTHAKWPGERFACEITSRRQWSNQWGMEDLRAVCATLLATPFARHEGVVRDALHAHNLPARAAIGLLGCHEGCCGSSGGTKNGGLRSDALPEHILVAISCDVVTRSAKKLLRVKMQPAKYPSDLGDVPAQENCPPPFFDDSVRSSRRSGSSPRGDRSSVNHGSSFTDEVASILDYFFPTPCWSRMMFVAFWVQAASGLPWDVDASTVLADWVEKAYALAMQAPMTLARSLGSHLGVQVQDVELRGCLKGIDPLDRCTYPQTFSAPRIPINLLPLPQFKTLEPIALNFTTAHLDIPHNPAQCRTQVRYALRVLHSEFFSRHQVLRVVVVLKVVKWMLFTYFTPQLRADMPAERLSQDLEEIRGLLTHAATLIANLACCPPELLSSMWALRGYVWEVMCEVELGFMDYLQALQILEDIWGDSRLPGKDGYGHPFALFLTWKLGHIAYLGSEVKHLDKFADIFRSLRRNWGSSFPWSPPFLPEGDGNESSPTHDALTDEVVGRALCHMESKLRSETHDIVKDFYDRYDPLNFPSAMRMTPQQRKKELHDLQSVSHGTVFAFGSNTTGQLGLGPPWTSKDVTDNVGELDLWWSGRPHRLMFDVPVKQVSCAESVSAAVTENGVYIWGELAGVVYKCPTTVHMPVVVDKVSCGVRFLLMVDEFRGLWTMGNGHDGVLGLGSKPEIFDGVTVPTKLDFDSGDVIDICCGAYHALCVGRNGQIWTWGRNEGGQLGHSEATLQELHAENDGSPFAEDTVVTRPIEVASNESFTFASCGEVHCAAIDPCGQVWTWGWGEFGQLGNGMSCTSLHKTKSQLGTTGAACRRFVPQRVQHHYFDHARVVHVAGGGNFTLAVTELHPDETGGKVFAFGGNEWGQCGLPARQPYDVDTPTLIEALRHTQIVLCVAGHSHALAFDVHGHVYAWGNSQYGQIGNITPPKFFAPPPLLDTRMGSRRNSDADAPTPVRTAYAMYDTPQLIHSVSKLRMTSGACGGWHSLILHTL